MPTNDNIFPQIVRISQSLFYDGLGNILPIAQNSLSGSIFVPTSSFNTYTGSVATQIANIFASESNYLPTASFVNIGTVSGSGTATYIPLLNTPTSLSSSIMYQSGGTIVISGSTNDLFQIAGSGTGRSGIYIRGTNTNGQATLYMDNDRGSFSTYAGFLVGSTANSVGNLFGVSRADKAFFFADGANNLGLGIGTLQAQPLYIGTNNEERMRINPAGLVSVGNGNNLLSGSGVIFSVVSASSVTIASAITNTNAAGQAGFFLSNDRLALGSYGGMFIGGSSTNLSNLFGQTRVDRVFMIADGTNNSGLVVGTLQAVPFILGTSNAERARFDATGRFGVGITPSASVHIKGSAGVNGGLRLDLGANSGNAATSYLSTDYNIPTVGLVGQILSTANNYFDVNVNLSSSSMGMVSTGNLTFITTDATIGFVTINAGGAGASFERLRITPTGRTGFSVTVPSALLHLKSGSTAANTAPLKVNAGTVMTTPESGSIEYDGSNLFISTQSGSSNSSTRYTLAKVLSTSSVLDFPSTAPGAISDITLSLPGVSLGDPVSLGIPNGSVQLDGIYSAWVSGSDLVAIRFTNTNISSSLDPASGSFKIAVIKL